MGLDVRDRSEDLGPVVPYMVATGETPLGMSVFIAVLRGGTYDDSLEVTISHRPLEAANRRAGILLCWHRFLSRPFGGLD